MTENEVAKLVYTVKAVYPAHFAKYTTQDYKNMIMAWGSVLEDYAYQQASAGLKIYMASETKGFPPSPGQVIDCITKAMNNDKMTNTECVARIRKALSNSAYNADYEFSKLPDICKKAVGSPRNLEEWCQIDSRDVETVIMSQVIKTLESTRVRMKEEAKIPERVKTLIAQISAPALEDKT